MAMTVMHNNAAQMTLGELQKNSNSLSKKLQQVASGMKINGAGDGAAEYAISERMQVSLRALDQDVANTQTGQSLVRTAEGGIQEIVNNLRSMKAMAVNAANDHNTDSDRMTIDKEFQSRKDTIDDIAVTTNYNGRRLLDGTYRQWVSLGGGNNGGDGIENQVYTKNEVEQPKAAAVTIPSGDYVIASDGVYELGAGYQGHITISATNVVLRQTDATVTETYISCTTPGTNLWLDGMNIKNGGQTDSAIRFTGAGNTLHVVGKNTILKQDTKDKAAINVGDGLTIQGETADNYLSVTNSWSHSATAIGGDTSEMSTAKITILDTNLYAKSYYGAAIGSGADGSIGDIAIVGGNIEAWGTGNGAAATIGYGMNGQCGNILVAVDSMNITLWDGAGNSGGGAIATKKGHIVLDGGKIHIESSATPAIVNSSGDGTVVATVNGQDYTSKDHVYDYDGPSMKTKYLTGGNAGNDTGAPLIIHTGTKANQQLRVYINDMRSKALGLTDVAVVPREKAVAALDQLDHAVDYALDEATNMGAYQARLGFTRSNLVTASENTQASESVIRDADMARAMTDLTKSNVLAQSAQAMLAQANQNSSSVLSLLQG
ncbi:MAG: flagellin [Selenomonadaceae bacterium]|nr:flagellin [Selenomonadaceae bacterium]